jgi:hypothetical protein
MPVVPTVTADGVKIVELAREKHGTVVAFGRAIGCHPRSISNMRNDRIVSLKFAEQIAAELGVPLSAITLADDPGQDEDDEAPDEPGEVAA